MDKPSASKPEPRKTVCPGCGMAENQTGSHKKKQTPEQYIIDHPHLTNEWWTEEQIHAHADAAHKYYKDNIQEFWMWQYCIDHDLPKTTVQRWIANNDYFSRKWELIKMICESRTYKYGCSKDVNSAMFMFGLKNGHGWRNEPQNLEADDHEIDRTELDNV